MTATSDRVRAHLVRLYPELNVADRDALVERVLDACDLSHGQTHPTPRSVLPGADEVVLITYGDSVHTPGQVPLQTFARFWRDHLADSFSTVHVLPFYPSSSDGGFSVVDYRQVDPRLGTGWRDLHAAHVGAGLMVDLVCNHGSAESEWFQQFIADTEPGRSFYVTESPETDLTAVVRPRTHPLLRPVETSAGRRYAWATFSHDQIDFDFSNPDVLVEFCSILSFYLDQGATLVRLDAIAYLWKQVGTSCIHLPQTHEVVKLFRTLADARSSGALIITETNVPHDENVSYFGDGDEAHVVYNFTLAPLLTWSVIAETATVLTDWLQTLSLPSPDVTFLNFLASHDGIGLRPIEDLVRAEDAQLLIDAVEACGGHWSAYATASGPRPYELNVSLADLLAGIDGENAPRYVAAHAVLLALQGIPAIYIHSMLVSPADHETVARTEHKRDINRSRLTRAEADQRVNEGWRSEIFGRLRSLIAIRRRHAAFAPTSAQVVHHWHDSVVAVERTAESEQVIALHNLTSVDQAVTVPLGGRAHDLIAGESIDFDDGPVALGPWQARWLLRGPRADASAR